MTRRHRNGAIVATATLVGACLLPTDDSDRLTVILNPIPELLVNDVVQLGATLVRGNRDTVPNATFRFASDSGAILEVSGTGEARALGRGLTIVTAEAVDFESATPAASITRVQGLVQIDSIRPATARVGDVIEVFGIGLADSLPGFVLVAADTVQGLVSAAAGLVGSAPDTSFTYYPPLLTFNGVPAPVASYRADGARHFGRGVLTAWVPLSATDPTVRVRTLRGEATTDITDPFQLDRRDLLEPNEVMPWNLGANPAVFYPALSFEAAGVDWYTWSTSTAGDQAFVLRWIGPGPDSVLVGPAVTRDPGAGTYGSSDWLTGTGFTCDGIPFRPPVRARRDSLVIWSRALPADTYHAVVFAGQPVTYSLQLHVPDDTASLMDALEENDDCGSASPVTLSAPQTLSLSIDQTADVDWFRFTVAAGQTGDVIARATAEAPGADLDLYLLRDDAPDSLPVLQSGTRRAQATEVLLAAVVAGDYYLVVVDFAGQATPYSLELSFTTALAGSGTER